MAKYNNVFINLFNIEVTFFTKMRSFLVKGFYFNFVKIVKCIVKYFSNLILNENKQANAMTLKINIEAIFFLWTFFFSLIWTPPCCLSRVFDINIILFQYLISILIFKFSIFFFKMTGLLHRMIMF